MPEAFQRVVVQIDVGLDDLRFLQRIRVDSKIVIVRRDLDFRGLKLFDRMIASMMAVFQLVGPAAQGQSNELVPKADAENRDPAQQPAYIVAGVRARFRVARAVRKKYAIRKPRLISG